MRSDPKADFSIIGIKTITLYFDNRPTDVKITEASRYVNKAIVKGNTVEVSLTHPIIAPYIHFTVSWQGGKKKLIYPNDPDDAVGDFLRADPPDGSSIVGVKKVRIWLDRSPSKNVKCYSHTSESFIKDIRISNNMIQFRVPHPIEEPSIRFTVSWTSRDGTVENSKELTYTNKNVAPKE